MLDLLRLLISFLHNRAKSQARLEAENLALRQQLIVLRRKVGARPRLKVRDRWLLMVLYRMWPGVLSSVFIVKPETVVRWHRLGFRTFWRWKSRNYGGRPKIDAELLALIRQMSFENPLWGAPRIHGELLKLGFHVCQSTVAKYMVKRPRPSGQGWKTFLRNHKREIASLDFFVVPTIGFKLLYCLVIIDHDRRKILWTAVSYHPTSEWVARQVTEAFPWDTAPQYMIRDNDGAFGLVYQRRLEAMGIRDRPTSPRSPWQNAYVERVIGSIRRECLDHVIVFSEAHLRRIMHNYAIYCNSARTHLSLGKDTPSGRPVQVDGRVRSHSWLGGLHHQYTRI